LSDQEQEAVFLSGIFQWLPDQTTETRFYKIQIKTFTTINAYTE